MMDLFFTNQVRLFVVIIFSLCTAGVAQPDQHSKAQSSNQDYESCDTLFKNKVGMVSRRTDRLPKRLSRPFDHNLFSPALSQLLKNVSIADFNAYRFKGKRKTALAMISTRGGAPMSESSIQDWFIQIGDKVVAIKSIATNPNLIFWDKKDRLNIFTILYSDMDEKRNSSNLVSLDFKQMQFGDNGNVELIEEEKNVQCILNVQKPR